MKLRSAWATLDTIFFTGSGRINRKQFWLIGTLLRAGITVAGFSLMLAGIFLVTETNSIAGAGITQGIGIAWVGIIFTGIIIFHVWTGIAVPMKRWHDIGLNGWMNLFLFIPWAGGIVWIVLGVIPGQETENKYGPIPLQKTNKGSFND